MQIDTDGIDLFLDDEPIQQAYEDAQARSQDSQWDNAWKRARFAVRHQLAEQILRRFPDLDIAECGCFWGHSMLMTADLGRKVGFKGRFHVFDSFEGLSEFQPEDDGPKGIKPEWQQQARARFATDFERTQALVSDYPEISLYKGWIPERFDEVADRTFSFVHIDVDLYQPTYDSLAFFWPRLVKGGAVYFDDYGYEQFPGARLAVDSYLEDKAPQLFLRMPVGSALVIK